MSWPYVLGQRKKVPSGRLVFGQKEGERLGAFQRVAGIARGHYVAAGVVTALHARLDVVHAQRVEWVDYAAVDTAPFVARKDFRSFHPVSLSVNLPDRSRRFLFERLRRIVDIDPDEMMATPDDLPPRLTTSALEALRMSRSRDRVLANLDEMYREAFDRAKATDDPSQMTALDFSYRREQLYFEILLDIRDAMERKS